MPVASIQTRAPQVKTEDIPLEKLETSKTLTQEQKVAEATRQFEAVLLRQIISEAQKPAFKSTLMPSGGVSGSIYQDIMVNQLAEKISSSHTLGVAQELQKQVGRQVHGSVHKKESPQSVESPQNAAPVKLTKAPRL